MVTDGIFWPTAIMVLSLPQAVVRELLHACAKRVAIVAQRRVGDVPADLGARGRWRRPRERGARTPDRARARGRAAASSRPASTRQPLAVAHEHGVDRRTAELGDHARVLRPGSAQRSADLRARQPRIAGEVAARRDRSAHRRAARRARASARRTRAAYVGVQRAVRRHDRSRSHAASIEHPAGDRVLPRGLVGAGDRAQVGRERPRARAAAAARAAATATRARADRDATSARVAIMRLGGRLGRLVERFGSGSRRAASPRPTPASCRTPTARTRPSPRRGCLCSQSLTPFMPPGHTQRNAPSSYASACGAQRRLLGVHGPHADAAACSRGRACGAGCGAGRARTDRRASR